MNQGIYSRVARSTGTAKSTPDTVSIYHDIVIAEARAGRALKLHQARAWRASSLEQGHAGERQCCEIDDNVIAHPLPPYEVVSLAACATTML